MQFTHFSVKEFLSSPFRRVVSLHVDNKICPRSARDYVRMCRYKTAVLYCCVWPRYQTCRAVPDQDGSGWFELELQDHTNLKQAQRFVNFAHQDGVYWLCSNAVYVNRNIRLSGEHQVGPTVGADLGVDPGAPAFGDSLSPFSLPHWRSGCPSV